MNKEKIIKVLYEINNEIRQNYKAEVKGIFGSYVRKEQKEKSDVDILVKFFKGATLFDLVGLANYIEEKLKIKVDIVPVDTIREEIRENILREVVYL
ncbi:MAG: nucleotidyltransferase family protein [Actinobacteria bacterium]|nr:nucleotidyltransferase family protein [Actinomycetota bacterium]